MKSKLSLLKLFAIILTVAFNTMSINAASDTNISLKSVLNNRYISANNIETKPLHADKTEAKGRESFYIINNSDGSVSLKAEVNQKYVRVSNSQELFADSINLGKEKKFTVATFVDGSIALKSLFNNKFITVSGNNQLIANGTLGRLPNACFSKIQLTDSTPPSSNDAYDWIKYDAREISIPSHEEGYHNITSQNSKIGTTEFLILSSSHGNPPADQIKKANKKISGGSWTKLVYAGNDDKSCTIWYRIVTSGNKKSMGRIDYLGGAAKLSYVVYSGKLNIGKKVAKNQIKADTISISNSGNGPWLVVATSDSGGNSSDANATLHKGDDIVLIYLTNQKSFKDDSVDSFRGAIASVELK